MTKDSLAGTQAKNVSGENSRKCVPKGIRTKGYLDPVDGDVLCLLFFCFILFYCFIFIFYFDFISDFHLYLHLFILISYFYCLLFILYFYIKGVAVKYY